MTRGRHEDRDPSRDISTVEKFRVLREHPTITGVQWSLLYPMTVTVVERLPVRQSIPRLPLVTA